MSAKERLDKVVFARGLALSREKARALIMAGQVIVDDHTVDKAGALVSAEADIRLKGEPLPYVSRGGVKLAKALDHFRLDVAGLVAIDVGASTGGFTDCLLQRGAKLVIAVDVGYGQLAWKLRSDPRVVNLEKTNIRYLSVGQIPAVPDMAVIDASFISLEKVLPATIQLLKEQAVIVALIKPQFEVGRGRVGKGGVVRDVELHDEVVARVTEQSQLFGLTVHGVTESPILGPKGNKEFLIHLTKDFSKSGSDRSRAEAP